MEKMSGTGPQVPRPVGWRIEKEDRNEELVIHWVDGQPAPESVLDKRKCTDMCKLSDCQSQPSVSDSEESTDEDENEEETE